MSSAALTSPAAPVHPWDARLTAVAEFVESHTGRFPNQHAVDAAEAELGHWWVEQAALAARGRAGGDLDSLRERAAQIRGQGDLAGLRARTAKIRERAKQIRVDAMVAYVDAHEGRFPPNRSDDVEVAALGCWWVAQNIALNQQRMDGDLNTQLEDLRERANQLRAAARARHAAAASKAARERSRALTLAAGRSGAVAAGEALKSPYLIPGDAAVLQLRIDHPDLSLAELADRARLSVGQFATKYYGALHRGPNSRTPLRKPFADRFLAPGAAADMIGVPRVTLSRWAEAGLVAADRNRQGHRRYRGAEVIRVKNLIAEGWPKEFVDADTTRRRK